MLKPVKKEVLRNPLTIVLSLFMAAFMVFAWIYPNKDHLFQTGGERTVTSFVTSLVTNPPLTYTTVYSTTTTVTVFYGPGYFVLILFSDPVY